MMGKPPAVNAPPTVVVSPSAYALALFIDRHTRAKGYAPSFREMREEMGFKQNGSIINLIGQLERAGIARRFARRAHRSIHIVPVKRHGVLQP